jgi:hypothetical protein
MRNVGRSLWKPEAGEFWLNPANDGPAIERLPSCLWLVGLGHLGQSFLWTIHKNTRYTKQTTSLGNFLKCCFSYFPNSHNISIGNNQKTAEL